MALDPNLPIVRGRDNLIGDLSIKLPLQLNFRFEDGEFIYSCSSMKSYINVWYDNELESEDSYSRWVESREKPMAFDHTTETDENLIRHFHRFGQLSDSNTTATFCGIIINDSSHVEMLVYFSTEQALNNIKLMWRGIQNSLKT